MINGLDGQRMLIALLIGIAILIILVLKTKVQAFLALIVTTVIVGIIGGMPLATEMIKVDGIEKPFGIVNSITTGFGGTLGNIGIIIGFGVMEALALTGFFVSIPIFCDSGFIVLAPIAKALSESTKKSVIGLGVALASGLVITHSLVPPTPGPLGVAGIFGIDVGKFILLTLVLAVPMTFACIAYSRKVLSKKFYRLVQEDGVIEKAEYQEPDYEAAFNMDMSGVPGTFESFAPLLLPIVLILINTVATAMGKTDGIMKVLIFLGQPIVAVGLGLIVAIFTLGRPFSREELLAAMERGMASAGIIMLVTGGGGALGQIIKDSGLGTYMADGLAKAAVPMIILPLVISTAMRFIQGSGTVAMTTAASISAPILLAAGVNPMLGAIACCVGSLFFGYFNDSYFWVVNRTLGVSEAKEQLRVWSITSTIAWAVGVVEVIALSFFM